MLSSKSVLPCRYLALKSLLSFRKPPRYLVFLSTVRTHNHSNAKGIKHSFGETTSHLVVGTKPFNSCYNIFICLATFLQPVLRRFFVLEDPKADYIAYSNLKFILPPTR